MLKLFPFRELTSWSVANLSLESVSSHFPFQKVKKFLEPSKDRVEIKDDTLYKQITVKINGNGVIKRGEKYGSEIGTKKQFVAKKGQLIVSKIDARNGAIGIVPEDLDGAVVTPDFMLFDVKNINIDYLKLILSSEKFREQWQSKSSGSTNRQRVNEKTMLESLIPVPPLNEQLNLVSSYKEAIDLLKKAEKKKEAALQEFKKIVFS